MAKEAPVSPGASPGVSLGSNPVVPRPFALQELKVSFEAGCAYAAHMSCHFVPCRAMSRPHEQPAMKSQWCEKADKRQNKEVTFSILAWSERLSTVSISFAWGGASLPQAHIFKLLGVPSACFFLLMTM